MFEPVSQLPYIALAPERQALIVLCTHPGRLSTREDLMARWGTVACAAVSDSLFCYDLLRDLLANPQVRAIVFDAVQPGCSEPWRAWFEGTDMPLSRKIDREHVTLLRQFVDIYDDEYVAKGSLQPWWPSRIRYLE